MTHGVRNVTHSFEDFLKQVPLFKDLEPNILSDINLSARLVNYAPGDVLFRQGDNADGMYMISEGTVRVDVRGPGDEVLEVAKFDRYDVLGELALMDKGPRNASATAEDHVAGYFITQQRFQGLQADLRPAAMVVMHRLAIMMAARCRMNIEEITAKKTKETTLTVNHDLPRHFPCETLPTDIANLANLHVFEHFDHEGIRQLLDKGKLLSLPRNTVVFRMGDAPDGVYIVLRGALRYGIQDKEITVQLNVHGPGQIAGCLEFLDEHSRACGLTACENSHVLYLNGPSLSELFKKGQPLSLMLLANINKQLVDQNRKLNNYVLLQSAFGKLNANSDSKKTVGAK